MVVWVQAPFPSQTSFRVPSFFTSASSVPNFWSPVLPFLLPFFLRIRYFLQLPFGPVSENQSVRCPFHVFAPQSLSSVGEPLGHWEPLRQLVPFLFDAIRSM